MYFCNRTGNAWLLLSSGYAAFHATKVYFGVENRTSRHFVIFRETYVLTDGRYFVKNEVDVVRIDSLGSTAKARRTHTQSRPRPFKTLRLCFKTQISSLPGLQL